MAHEKQSENDPESRQRRSYHESGELLVRELRPALVRQAQRAGLRREDAEEAVQEAFLALFAQRPEPRSLAAWLRCVVDRRSVDALRRERVRRAWAARENSFAPTDDSASQTEARATLAAAVTRLPPRERAAIQARYLAAEAPAPGATGGSAPRATSGAKKALGRALRRLRLALTGYPAPPPRPPRDPRR